jgi:hypothetical protein
MYELGELRTNTRHTKHLSKFMMFSKALLSTDKQKTTLNWWEYYIGHCWMTGWQSIRGAFRIWADLMGSNYKDYALPRTAEDPEQECIEWFWVTLGEDDVYSKEFLEYLMQMVDDVRTGKEKTFPMDLDELMKDLEE